MAFGIEGVMIMYKYCVLPKVDKLKNRFMLLWAESVCD
jgi:hypothetical protein